MKGDYRVGEWLVSPLRRTIERGERSVQVKPKSMAVLEQLVAARGEPVSRNDLHDSVWPGAEVTDDVLTQCIVELRRAFGDSARESRVIETIPKLGFRLLLPVEPVVAKAKADGPPAAAQQPNPAAGKTRAGSLVFTLVAVLLLGAALLSLPGTRLWLIERGTTLVLQAAALVSPHRLVQEPGIAVLPLVNFSGDPENEYFSDGMSVEIINRLSSTNLLPVIALSSTFEFKDRFEDVREIGRQLGVSHVLEGSVRRSGLDIRMTVQLIDTSKGTHVWSGIYQRKLGDIFALQDEIARDIVREISVALGDLMPPMADGEMVAKFIESRPTHDLRAYELFLKGVEMVTSTRPRLIQQSVDYFDRAIALDEDYADAWAAKGYALGVLGWGGSGSSRIPASVYPGAIAAFERALEIEPQHAFAQGFLGVTLMENDFKWAEGMEMLEHAVAHSPNNPTLLAIYGHYLGVMGLPGADEIVNKAYRLDPFGVQPMAALFAHLMREGRLLASASLLEASLIHDGDGYTRNFLSARVNLRLGRLDAAEDQLRKARLVANLVDLNLDTLEGLIEARRGNASLPWETIWERMQTEHLADVVLWQDWADEKAIVAVFDLAIEQRHPELRSVLFGPKPQMMPESDWRRIKEITGVTQYQQSRGLAIR